MSLKIKLSLIPETPGCYLFKDEKEKIIYVGKSKYLPNRVMSYFRPNPIELKTKALLERIKDVDFISTINENEAILLEDDLIKLYRPKFNVKGKDDRTKKWGISFSCGDFPKLEITPIKTSTNDIICEFSSSNICHEVYETIHRIVNLRNCSYNLSKNNIENKKFKSCLEFHINRCSAPCESKINKFDYKKNCDLAKEILTFNYKKVETHLWKIMKSYSDSFEFEKALQIKFKIDELEKIKILLEPSRIQKSINLTKNIKKILNLKNTPLIIESFDNSHHNGDCIVSASVRFVNGLPEKSSYRKYNLKNVVGPDDYASFDEVIYRRLKRLLDEKGVLPSMILIDGGKGQLNVGKTVLTRLNLLDKIDLISISKNNNHKSETIHLCDSSEIKIESSEEFFYLSKIQEEVHRFTINFHRDKKSKKLIS